MLQHYLSTALANFRKTPFTTATNVLTLALGLACFISACGIASYWRSADDYHENAERTYVVGQSLTLRSQADRNPVLPRSTATLAKYLVQDFSEIERIARVYNEPGVAVAAGSRKVLLDSAFADPVFLEMFDLQFIAGDARRALIEPGSVVLTQDAARRLFGAASALGRSVLLDDGIRAIVTGVIAPVRQPSFMGQGAESLVRFDMLGRWDVHPGGVFRDAEDFWRGTSGFTFVALSQETSPAAFNDRLAEFVERRMPADQRQVLEMRLSAFPLSEMTTRSMDNLLLAQNGLNLTAASVLIAFGVVILLVASINYANLATAQAAVRVKQVAMRRVLGAGRASVMIQSWLETMSLSVAALVLALGLLALVAPVVRAFTEIDILFFLFQGVAPALLMVALVVIVGLLAGAYPALALSGMRPLEAMRSARSRAGPRSVGRVLVGLQFAAASFLLILLTVAQMQRRHLEQTGLASQEDPIVVLNDLQPIGVDLEVLAGALSGRPGIEAVSGVDRPPWITQETVMTLARSPEAATRETQAYLRNVNDNYFSTLSFDVLAGSTFVRRQAGAALSPSALDPSQPIPLVIDGALARALGYPTPQAAVDQTVYLPQRLALSLGRPAAQPLRIIGVVNTDVMRLGAGNASGHMYLQVSSSPVRIGHGPYPLVRISRHNVARGLKELERVWDQLVANVPADVRFFDDLFERAYRQYRRVSQLFIVLGGVTLLIAALGQIGMAVHIAARRRHEIAVRKTLGSTAGGAVGLLLVEFSKPVVVSNLIAWPLGYVAAETYLSAFAHRIDLTLSAFAISMAISLAIAWLAVGGQTLKTARVRPVEVLRYE